jgi:hypothetical protein
MSADNHSACELVAGIAAHGCESIWSERHKVRKAETASDILYMRIVLSSPTGRGLRRPAWAQD